MKLFQRKHSSFRGSLSGFGLTLILPIFLGWITAVTHPATPLTAEPSINVSLIDTFPDLTFNFPVDIAQAGDSRLFIVEQTGNIKVVSLSSPVEAPIFLDLKDRITFSNEMGLLGLVFHPDYTNNGYFYVNYTHQENTNSPLFTYVSRFQVSGNANIADANSELIILRIQQPYTNHNGGDLAFGSDGYLYVGLGDGGSGGDPQNNAQTPSTLLGSMLRLDVDGGGQAPDCGQGPTNYTIPADNPFVADADSSCDEIWATGLRNPWRYSFDRQFDDLYIGDVGQNAWEEIDFQPANTGGLNYGWRCYEGNHPYNTAGCNPDTTVYTFPIDEYGQENGRCAVTGGFVYRGSWYPELNGRYFYSDYCSGEIWSLETDPPGAFAKTVHLDTPYRIATFGEDAYGELYLADRTGGHIYRLQDDTVASYLHVKKVAPLTAVANQPFTYTLTVQNSANFTMTNVTITDTLPSSASYVNGGSLINNIVSWPAFDLAPYSEQSVQFTVTTTTTLINSNYRASADDGHEATGTAVVTLIGPVSQVYLPSVLKPR